MKKRSFIYMSFMLISQTISNEQEYEGGFVNGQQVGKCVAGFCLPFEYQKLEPPSSDVNQISIETDIMDVLMVCIWLYVNIHMLRKFVSKQFHVLLG